jgi:hypothetical protein
MSTCLVWKCDAKENDDSSSFIFLETTTPSPTRKRVAKKPQPPPVLFVPEVFDPERLLASTRKHLGDRARYLLHIIHTRMIFDHRKRHDGVRLMAKYLRRFMGKAHYRGIIQDLEQAGVIEIVRKARDGQAYLYRLGAVVRKQTFRKYDPQDRWLVRALRQWRNEQDRELTCPVRRYLREQLKRVRIDFAAATKRIRTLSFKGEGRIDAENCLLRLHDQDWYFVPDDYGRVHHNLTCLKRELREYLFVDGEPLVEIDIANSQPLFLGLAFFNWIQNNKSLSTLHSKDGFLVLSSFKEDNIEHYLSSSFSHKVQEEEHKRKKGKKGKEKPLRCPLEGIVNNADALKYLALCEKGEFYKALAEMIGKNVSSPDKMNAFKESVYGSLLFAKKVYPNNKLVEAFSTAFPSVYELVVAARVKDKSRLAGWMQRIESAFVIDRVVKRLMAERPDRFFTTIHDAVLTTPGNAGYVEQVFREEFASLGVQATVRRK